MNLFVSDPSPIISARNLDDKRVNHMSRETLELLILSIYKNYGIVINPLLLWGGEERKQRFNDLLNHGVTNWVARKPVNTWWTYRHLFALFDEYKFRFGKSHYLYDLALSLSHYYRPINYEPPSFYNATGLRESDIFKGYKECLMIKWYITDDIKPVIWTKRGAPHWNTSKRLKQLELFDYTQFKQEEEWELPF